LPALSIAGELPTGANVISSLSRIVQETGGFQGREVQVLQLPDMKVLHRLIAQTAAQPGIMTVW